MSDPRKNDLKNGEILSMFKAIEESSTVTQRELSFHMGISLGKVNYIINVLISRGLVKANTFKKSNNKQAYLYILAPL